MTATVLSVDQNCHSLWDVLPKLQALAGRGYAATHFIEDIDIAFTQLGAGVEAGPLHIARERYHRSGGADWGAALFYSEFLGRLPVDIRRWEVLTGMKTAALAKQLGRTVDDLYDEFSPGDNWQLIGPSYVGDRDHHRLIADLSVAETAEFIRQVFGKARADCEAKFPDRDCRRRLAEWFDREEARLERLLASCERANLPELYRRWLGEHLGETVQLSLTSNLAALRADSAAASLLRIFTTDYDTAAGLYNQALDEADVGLRPLDTRKGELPFFVTQTHQGHLVRTGLFFQDGALRAGGQTFALAAAGEVPIEAMRKAGIGALAGKAVLLVIQARLGRDGRPLALPHHGSLYMPAVKLFAASLASHGLLVEPLKPLLRVRFRLLDRMKSLPCRIGLGEHLRRCYGQSEISARQLGETYASMAQEAARRLESLQAAESLETWQEDAFPDLTGRIADLEARKRRLAKTDPKSEEIRAIWREIKQFRTDRLERTLRRIADDYQISRIDYWDSRGALMPWSIAMGGAGFYNDLIAHAEISEETL